MQTITTRTITAGIAGLALGTGLAVSAVSPASASSDEGGHDVQRQHSETQVTGVVEDLGNTWFGDTWFGDTWFQGVGDSGDGNLSGNGNGSANGSGSGNFSGNDVHVDPDVDPDFSYDGGDQSTDDHSQHWSDDDTTHQSWDDHSDDDVNDEDSTDRDAGDSADAGGSLLGGLL